MQTLINFDEDNDQFQYRFTYYMIYYPMNQMAI